MPPNASQSSFIPKRGPAQAKRRKPAKRIFLFSLISYSLIFASLLAAGGSYLYKNYMTSLLQNEVVLLDSEIDTFSVADLSVVAEFDLTLKRAADRIDHSASIVTVLDAIDSVTALPVQIVELDLTRSGDQELVVVANIATQSFDSAIFQRQLLVVGGDLFTNVVIEDVAVSVASAEDELQTSVSQPITFTATLSAPIEVLPYRQTPVEPVVDVPSIPISNPATTSNQTAL